MARERDREYADGMMELSYRRHRFPPVVIQHAVWLYLRFTLSYRDVEDLLAERGLDICYETVRSWVLKFGPVIARRARVEIRRLWRPRCMMHAQRSPLTNILITIRLLRRSRIYTSASAVGLRMVKEI